MRTVIRRILLPLVLLTALSFASAVVGQDDDLNPDQSSAQTAAGRSFADQFFIARRTDQGGHRSIEVLGSLIIWFLLLLSVLGVGLIGHLAMANQRKSILPAEAVDQVRALMSEGKYREVLEMTGQEPSFFSQVLHAALGQAGHGFGAVIRRLEQAVEELTTMRLRRIEYLNVLGQVSPMIGLFGTVYGMILAFQAIVVAGGNADPVLLAGGIGTALTTTFWGLIVAIPALAGYGIIRNKIDELTTEAALTAQELLNQLRPKSAGERGTDKPSPSAKQRPEA